MISPEQIHNPPDADTLLQRLSEGKSITVSEAAIVLQKDGGNPIAVLKDLDQISDLNKQTMPDFIEALLNTSRPLLLFGNKDLELYPLAELQAEGLSFKMLSQKIKEHRLTSLLTGEQKGWLGIFDDESKKE